jgi:hypothetical protein
MRARVDDRDVGKLTFGPRLTLCLNLCARSERNGRRALAAAGAGCADRCTDDSAVGPEHIGALCADAKRARRPLGGRRRRRRRRRGQAKSRLRRRRLHGARRRHRRCAAHCRRAECHATRFQRWVASRAHTFLDSLNGMGVFRESFFFFSHSFFFFWFSKPLQSSRGVQPRKFWHA